MRERTLLFFGTSCTMASDLLSLLSRDVALEGDAKSITIAGLTADSRNAAAGFVFAALPGVKDDGARFVPDAVGRGAVAILTGRDTVLSGNVNVPVIRADEPRLELALMAARFYGPGPDTIVAVTGTSGKTTVAEFTRQICAACGRKSASMGTLGIVKPDGAVDGSLTTPDPVTIAATLADLRAQGVTHLAMEASSHGLDQYRLDGVAIQAGAFTNLGRDHLDYHPTIEAYGEAKLNLFSRVLQPGQAAVINVDDAFSAQVLAAAVARGLVVSTVGVAGQTLQLVKRSPQGFGQRLDIVHAGHNYTVNLPLVGAYQASNALVAAGLAIAAGEHATSVIASLPHLKGVAGRLQVVGRAKGALGVVDYAHKPEALAAALDALRPFAMARLICVFGCGGDRDRGKRAIMGTIATDKANIVIVTDDNPRSEDPAAIRAEILAGAIGAIEIGDRAAAIEAAVAMLGHGDVLVVAGKGHESGQIVGSVVHPFSDVDVLTAALARARGDK